MKKQILLFSVAVIGTIVSGCAQPAAKTEKQIGSCEDCDLMFAGMPAKLSWSATIAGPAEPGERLIISGTIYRKDGKTPAPGVILYVYHTDNKGNYSPGPDQQYAKRHGHLRGWMQTDAQGRYEFKTVRPASYPNSKNPQHVHPIIDEPGKGYYWIDEYLFKDDPLLTSKEKSNQPGHGGLGIISLKKNAEGAWIGKRDIVLGENIPGY